MCIFHILNEISQHSELMDTILVRNYSYIYLEDYQIKYNQHLKSTIKVLSENY